jgi:hypothetical protein
MATVLSSSVFPEDYDYKTPKHLIMWLDDYIGDPERYLHLKKAFTSNIDPRNQAWTMLTGRDYDNLLRVGETMEVSFGGVLFLLLAFTNPQACYRAVEQYKDRRVLFITSGTLGRNIVPRVIQDYQQVFTDPVTNNPYNSIYVFCHDIGNNYDWAMEHLDYIQIFNHEADLLTRMTRDMADYYFTQGEHLRATGHLEDALRFYRWSKKLFLQYEKMNEPCRKYLENIDRITKEIENTLCPPLDNHNYEMRENDSDDEEGKGCEPCS